MVGPNPEGVRATIGGEGVVRGIGSDEWDHPWTYGSRDTRFGDCFDLVDLKTATLRLVWLLATRWQHLCAEFGVRHQRAAGSVYSGRLPITR